MKYSPKSKIAQTCYITHTQKRKKEKESEMMNRKGVEESSEKKRGVHEGQSSEDLSLTLQVVLSIKVFSVSKREAVKAQSKIKGVR